MLTTNDAWDVIPPAGWEPVAQICRDMFGDLDAITDRINARIAEEIEEFHLPGSVVSPPDIKWSTGGGVANFLRGVGRREPSDERDRSFQRLIGQRSVARGLPLEPLIATYHIGFRELWSILASRAKDGPAATLLLEHGSIVWERLLDTTSALAEGYRQEVARRKALESTAAAHFLEALALDPSTEDARALARELGLDPDERFQVVALGGSLAVSDAARALTAALHATGAPASWTQRGRIAIVFAQPDGDKALDAALEAIPAGTAAGVGGASLGLAGARLSLSEAERALALANGRGDVCRFDEEWLLATVASNRESTARLLDPGIALATAKPHLAEAIAAFGANGFSVAETARALGVSPNSLRYRLTRWQELTGWDPWSLDGLARSTLALGAAGAWRARAGRSE